MTECFAFVLMTELTGQKLESLSVGKLSFGNSHARSTHPQPPGPRNSIKVQVDSDARFMNFWSIVVVNTVSTFCMEIMPIMSICGTKLSDTNTTVYRIQDTGYRHRIQH